MDAHHRKGIRPTILKDAIDDLESWDIHREKKRRNKN